MRVFVLASATWMLGMAAAFPAGQVFRTGVDLVNFGVTVVDKKGNLVTSLGENDFAIFEDGQKQTIRYFGRGDEQEAPELHLGLLLDTSGSMEEDMKLARSAAIKFLNELPQAVDMTLVDFDTEVRVARYGQMDFPRMVERIRGRKAEGWTALYDALGVYLDGAGPQSGRKVLVLYTDGGDTTSTLTFADMMTLLKASDVTVYAIGLLEHQFASTRTDQRMRLQQITDTTGGQAFFPTSMKEVEKTYEQVLAEMRAQYSLGYSSTNENADGAWRKVEIKITNPQYKIRTRKGYFAPYKQATQH